MAKGPNKKDPFEHRVRLLVVELWHAAVGSLDVDLDLMHELVRVPSLERQQVKRVIAAWATVPTRVKKRKQNKTNKKTSKQQK
jgi:hypothetical protein